MALDLNALLSAAIENAVTESVNTHYLELKQQNAELMSRIAILEAGAGDMANHSHQVELTFSPEVVNRRIDALFTLLSAIIQTDDAAIERAGYGGFVMTENMLTHICNTAAAKADEKMDAHHIAYDHDDIRDSHEIKSLAEEAIADYDMDDKINNAVGDLDEAISEAIDNYDFDEKMEAAIDNYDMDDKIDSFDFTDKVSRILRNASIRLDV